MSMGRLIVVAIVALVAAAMGGSRRPRWWLALNWVGTAALLGAAMWILGGGAEWEWRSAFAVGGERLHLRLDRVGGWFLVLVAVIGGAGAAYARGYWPDRERPASAGRGRAWWSALVLCMALVLLCANGLHFLMAWEAFALSAFFLITLERERREVRMAGWLYLAASHAGTLALFAFFCLLAARTGSWDLGPMRDRPGLAPLFWVALFGFGVKAGVFPLHVWLPSAHANAPSHVSAIMSGVAIKMGLYGVVRFGGWLPVPAGAGWVLLAAGATSAVLGSAFALAQNDLKRLLAYCSVENMGIMLIGVGTGLLGAGSGDAAWGRVAMAGALLHVWNHGLFKSLLFFGAGSVAHATGTREMSRLGGLWRSMPWTAGLFAFGSMAIAALPPLNGFVSEWMVYLGLLDAAAGHARDAAVIVPATMALGLAGALALAASVKASAVVFLGAARTRVAAGAHECGWWMRLPMLGLAGACVCIALAPLMVWPLIQRSLGTWNIAWRGDGTPVPLAALGAAQCALVAVVAAGGFLLWFRARANGLRRAGTWDCGYSAPTARMQYTGGSFSALAVGWFAWVLRPDRRRRWPKGPFPRHASRVERIPEAVLERVIGPVGDVVMGASAWVRRRQQGVLPDYILYLVLGLVAVGLLVALGGVA
ncbi:MAG: NADH-quinone oxidoreductase subunit H [Verrucomicrobiae bacterium]|nr:NADH-quinone oxidoreductase subunit H [Verrucomicrobiae bacterium]